MLLLKEKEQYQQSMKIHTTPLQRIDAFIAPAFPKCEEDVEFLETVPWDNFIFNDLSTQERVLIIHAMIPYKAWAGEVIVKQGDIEDNFHVLKSGKVRFSVDGKQVGGAYDGVSFGELALLCNSPGSVTVMALTECYMYRIDQQTFRTVLASNKAQADRKRVHLLRRVEIFKNFDTTALSKISDAMSFLVVANGTPIIDRTDSNKPFYVIQYGEVEICESCMMKNKEPAIKTLRPGDYFGDQALVKKEKRTATAPAIGECTLLYISKETCKRVIGSIDHLHLSSNKQMLMSLPFFDCTSLKHHEWEHLSQAMVRLSFSIGKTLLEEGKPATNIEKGLYLVREGEVALYSFGELVNTLGRGDWFGDDLLQQDPNFASSFTATVIKDAVINILAVEDICITLGALDRLKLNSLPQRPNLCTSVTSERLESITSLLAHGKYGKLFWLTTDKRIHGIGEYIKNKQLDTVTREKKLVAFLDHPFLLRLINASEDYKSLSILQPLILGGDLFTLIHNAPYDGISEKSARFYGANIYDGLMHMHNRNVVHRDLKPENILIGQDGYCILINLGFAKVVTEKTYTLCGASLYLAPEVILSRGYDKSADNWSFGALVFEMAFGHSPFFSYNINQATLLKRIIEGNYIFPARCKASANVKDLISQLLVLNPAKRLGNLANNDHDIRDHPWLASLAPSEMYKKQIKSPWKRQSMKSDTNDSYLQYIG